MRNVLRLFVTADGRPAVRAFEEVGAASEKSAAKVDRSAKASSASMSRMHGSISTLAGAVGVGGLAIGIKDVVQAGERWQAQQAQLQGALKATGNFSLSTLGMINRTIDSLSTHGGFDESTQLAGITRFLSQTHSVTQAMRMNADATNIARRMGVDYSSAVMMVSRAMTGSTGRLQQYLGIIQPVKTAEYALAQAHKVNLFQLELQSKALGKAGPMWLKQQELLAGITPLMTQHAQLLDKQATAQMVLTRIQQVFGNATATYSRTSAGAVSNLKDSWDNLKRELGVGFLPVLNKVVSVLVVALGWLDRHRTAMYVLIGIVSGLTLTWGLYTVAMAAATAATVTWGVIAGGVTAVISGVKTALLVLGLAFEAMGLEATAAWAAATLGLSLLVAGIIWAATHWTQFKHIIEGVWQWIKQNWPLLAAVLLAPFTLGISLVAGVLWRFRGTVGSVVKSIGSIFGTVLHAIEWPFQQAWKGIQPILNTILTGIRWMVKEGKKALHDLSNTLGFTGGGPMSYVNPIGLGKHVFNGLSSLFGHTGGMVPGGLEHRAVRHFAVGGSVGPIRHMADGGMLGGYGGGDRIPAVLEAGEFVLRKEAVQTLGGQNAANAINQTGRAASDMAGMQQLMVTMPIQVRLPGGRILAEETVRFSAKKSALSGRYVSG